ncbi:cytochrome c oxidase assembly factor Coa1 family protein [Aquimarina sp. 2201CG14-23]|uniref:cytochrome c oxidase assembly factor Coa1 family protein n=1 Tax=Aquimarina mycalae TaxID=3040073 RepID=UPI0024782608|nr:cytochrome c oxidase assembly factor Coa1 family protein [Aquimarina sp. 2201CG14-23]MDH7446102.1 cytochrome c oxidase assembly factor Coa1 family protein [Aquimarina sp. 2201CG14-23]
MEEHRPQKSWFSRNWPWVVPVGGCLTLIIVFFVFLGSVVFGVSKALTSSTPYQDALAKAQEDEYIIQLLGEPIETNGIMQGELNFKNNTGMADISIPIKGPEGEARIYVVGTKQHDNWTYSELYVIIEETNEQVDLLWGAGNSE